MNPEYIVLISFGQIEKTYLDLIARDVEREFSLTVKTKDDYLDLTDFFDPSRRQYNGNLLLKKIDTGFASDSVKTIGLFNEDLFIPILTYIFGQAYLNGRSGIASMFRLSNERYGLKMDDQLMLDRFSKEIIHELGHTFGLIHCIDPTCVMRASTYVEDIDQKSKKLCNNCRLKIGHLPVYTI
jgi:archaemetzincin